MTSASDFDSDLPVDMAAEQAVLGLALRDPEQLVAARAHLNGGGEFLRPGHVGLWQILCSEYDAGHPIDPVTIAGFVRADKKLRRSLGQDPDGYIHTLFATPATPDAGHYARIVADHHRSRRWIEVGKRIVQMGHQADPEAIDMLAADQLEVMVNDIEHRVTPGGLVYVDWTDFFSRPRLPVTWHASPLVAAARVTLLYSPGKTGKSLIAQEIAVALAIGAPVLGSPAAPPRHVLYVDQEMTEDDWLDRLRDMGYGAEVTPLLNQYLHLAQLQTWPPLDTPAGGRALAAAAADVGAQVVIIDTISKLIAGEENSNDTHGALYRHTLVPLKRAGLGVLILDHTGKDVERGARGGSAKTDNVDLAFELLVRGHDLLSLRCSHARFRDDALLTPSFLRRDSSPLHHSVEDHFPAPAKGAGLRPTRVMEKVSKYVEINPGVSKKSIETALGGRAEIVRLALNLLVSEGFVHATKGPHNADQHRLLNPYLEEDDHAG